MDKTDWLHLCIEYKNPLIIVYSFISIMSLILFKLSGPVLPYLTGWGHRRVACESCWYGAAGTGKDGGPEDKFGSGGGGSSLFWLLDSRRPESGFGHNYWLKLDWQSDAEIIYN